MQKKEPTKQNEKGQMLVKEIIEMVVESEGSPCRLARRMINNIDEGYFQTKVSENPNKLHKDISISLKALIEADVKAQLDKLLYESDLTSRIMERIKSVVAQSSEEEKTSIVDYVADSLRQYGRRNVAVINSQTEDEAILVRLQEKAEEITLWELITQSNEADVMLFQRELLHHTEVSCEMMVLRSIAYYLEWLCKSME